MIAKRKRLNLIYMAGLAKASKRHEDVLDYMRKLIRIMRTDFRNQDMIVEEKLLFNTAFKNLLLLKRRQWRSVFVQFDEEEKRFMLDENEEAAAAGKNKNNKNKEFKLRCILIIKKRIEQEIRDLCKECYIETRYFLRAAVSQESRVFYLRILADTFRYLSQIENGHALIRLMQETDTRYMKAMAESQGLEVTNPLKLALALNYATYKYEIEQNFEHAIEIALTAFNESLLLFQSLDGREQIDTMKMMALLEDNLAIFRKAEFNQKKKAKIVEFDDEQLNLLKKGFDDEDMVSLAGSSLVSYDTLV